MQTSLCTIAALAIFTLSASAQSYVIPAPRRLPSCALLDGGKIYCFGGQIGAGKNPKIDTTLFALDTNKIRESNTPQWEQIVESANSDIFTTYPRTKAAIAVTADKKTMIIAGGKPLEQNAAYVQNIAYDVHTNAWRTLPTFDDGANGNSRYVYVGTSTWVPEQSKAYFFGGLEFGTSYRWYYDSVLGRNLTNAVFESDNTTSRIGYYRMTTLDIAADAANPWQVPTQTNPPSLSYYKQSAVYHPASKKIFYFGGLFNDATHEEFVKADKVRMNQALTFDTVNNVWETQSFTGALTPSNRIYHTLTLLPSGQDILLYGGASDEDSSAVQDFCFTASLETFVWTSCSTISSPNSFDPLIRTEHAAVLDESKSLLYILFGYVDTRIDTNAFNTVVTLDVKDPRKIELVVSSQHSSAPGSNNNGAIIGGAVGGSVGAIIIICIVAAFIIRKKLLAKRHEQENVDHLSVDWNALEEKYIETTSPIPPANYSYDNQNLSMSNGSTANIVTVPDANIDKNSYVNDNSASSRLITKPDVHTG